ncbi:MAG: response regulator, partial [Bacteroidetes bacterium]|nr:response regulator [Bacteroidota bacterium]
VFGIPVVKEKQKPKAGDQKKSSTERVSLSILLAEDNYVNQQIAVRYCEEMGHKVDVAGRGTEVIRKLRKNKYDVILMDVQMPEMNGIDTTRIIRNNTDGLFDPAIPIIALTAYALEEDMEEIMSAGMDHFLAKPIDFDSLEGLLARIGEGKDLSGLPDNKAVGKDEDKILERKDVLDYFHGDEELLRSLYIRFTTDEYRRFLRFLKAMDEDNIKEAVICAHQLKGACAILGANRFHALISEVEKFLKENSADKVSGMLEEIKSAFEAVSDEMKKYF